MRAVIITGPGEPEVLEIREVPVPDPGPGEVRVGVRAFALNRADLLQRRGMHPAPADSPQDIPGLEYAGVVDALGPDVEDLSVGDRVMGIVGGGAYAQYLITPAAHAVAMPSALTFEEAAAIPEAFITAHDALERLAVTEGEWVLVHAVGSGVGTAAVQLIKAREAKCVGTSRTRRKLDEVVGLGMDEGIDTSEEDMVAAVQRITGRGANAAVDLVGGSMFPATVEAMAPRGRIIVVGLTAGRRADLDLGLVMRKRLRIEGTVLRARSRNGKTAVVQSFRQQVLPLFSTRRLRAVVGRVFSFDEIRTAHEYLESNVSYGKVVVRMA